MKKYTELEICTFSVESCLAAQRAGADRIELCSGFAEGGLTPSAGRIQQVRKNIDIGCYVMIRPRGGDFCYSDAEMDEMRRDIIFARSSGVDGVVLGILQPNGHVNITRTRELVQLASPMKVTFHRAFDHTADPMRALEDIIVSGCHRILTSGQKSTAAEGIDTISRLVERSAGRIDIMAGSGVNPSNAALFAESGVQALHFSAKTLRKSSMVYHNPDVPIMQTDYLTDDKLVVVDEHQIREMLRRMGR